MTDTTKEYYQWVKASERLPEFKGKPVHLVDDFSCNLPIKANGLHFTATFFHYKKCFVIGNNGDPCTWNENVFEKFDIYWLEKLSLPTENEWVAVLQQIDKMCDISIPYYAYGDNEAACEMASRINEIREFVNSLPHPPQIKID